MGKYLRNDYFMNELLTYHLINYANIYDRVSHSLRFILRSGCFATANRNYPIVTHAILYLYTCCVLFQELYIAHLDFINFLHQATPFTTYLFC